MKNIIDRAIEDGRVARLLYCLDDSDDYRDRNVWIKANPNLNVSVIDESLQAKMWQSDEAVDQRADIRIKQSNENEWVDGHPPLD